MKARNASGLSPLSDTATATVPVLEEEEEPLIATQQNSGSGILVSNFRQEFGEVYISQKANIYKNRFAQSFRAANYWDGSTAEFDFTGITILMSPALGGHMNALLVTVHPDSGGVPGEILHTLGTPKKLSGGDYPPVLYSAPAGSTLSSGVTYWVKLDTKKDPEFFMGDMGGVPVIRTARNGEEQGGASLNKWEIDDDAIESKVPTPNTWETSEGEGLAMKLLGKQRFQVLVSTMNQPSLSNHGISNHAGGSPVLHDPPRGNGTRLQLRGHPDGRQLRLQREHGNHAA